jgi:acetate kinase
MKILVLNCGSSSIKYQFFSLANNAVIAKGIVEKIGMKGSFLKHEKEDGQKVMFEGEILDHKIGIEYILGVLSSAKHGCIENLEEISAVGHRVVHGGELFTESKLVNEDVIAALEKYTELAPLHNPPNLKGIYALRSLIPSIPQVAVFDTAFHTSIPKHAYMYAIPYSLYKKYGIRRYGFHGTSHRYVYSRACEILGVDPKGLKIVTCHLGNGASVCAIKDGISVDSHERNRQVTASVLRHSSFAIRACFWSCVLGPDAVQPEPPLCLDLPLKPSPGWPRWCSPSPW